MTRTKWGVDRGHRKDLKIFSISTTHASVRSGSGSVDDPPARRELRVWSRHLIFLGNQETLDKALCEILGKLSVTRGEDGTPPRRPSEEGTQTVFGLFTI